MGGWGGGVMYEFRRKSERKRVVFIFLAGICYSAVMTLAMLFFRSSTSGSFPSREAPKRYVSTM